MLKGVTVMAFFDKIKSGFMSAGGAMQNAVGVVAEKNRKTALANRLRTVIRCEEKAAERAYLALGRYYYHNLRNEANAETETHCIDIEAAEKRIEDAMLKLEALLREDDAEPSIEEVTLDEVQVLTAVPVEESVPEGFVDEAVEAAIEAAEPASVKVASEDLPYA